MRIGSALHIRTVHGIRVGVGQTGQKKRELLFPAVRSPEARGGTLHAPHALAVQGQRAAFVCAHAAGTGGLEGVAVGGVRREYGDDVVGGTRFGRIAQPHGEHADVVLLLLGFSGAGAPSTQGVAVIGRVIALHELRGFHQDGLSLGALGAAQMFLVTRQRDGREDCNDRDDDHDFDQGEATVGPAEIERGVCHG